jgi:hypothetical protein
MAGDLQGDSSSVIDKDALRALYTTLRAWITWTALTIAVQPHKFDCGDIKEEVVYKLLLLYSIK